MDLRSDTDILAILHDDASAMDALAAVRSLHLPDAWIGAGFVRNRVWDVLHGIRGGKPDADVDVVYFDASDHDEATEKHHEAALHAVLPGLDWSVKNQAHMHVVNGDAPYRSTLDAIAHWPETATCVAVQMDDDGTLRLGAPHGTDDLLGVIVRPGPRYRGGAAGVRARMEKKGWLQRWRNLRIVEC